MSSNPEKNNELTVPPDNAGANSNASEPKDALTVELSHSTGTVNVGDKTSVLTTGPLDYEILTPSLTTVNTADATVIRDRNSVHDASGSNSSRTQTFTSQIASNDGVIIVDNDLIDGYVPRMLDSYQIIRKIGSGGMGSVFLAKDVYLDRQVAIKILQPKYLSTELQERFIVEAKAAAKLHHDNIVTIYSFGETNNLPFFAMEYISGSDIKSIVEDAGPLPIDKTLAYAIQIASALEHINVNGIVHRDIKPSNVLITEYGTAKVIDLGLAKDYLRQPDDGLTKTGVTLGTFDYISPEQANDPRNVDIRADIYSLGCTIFFMLIGKPPYAEKNRMQKIVSHNVDQTPDIVALRPGIPGQLAEIVVRCMAKDPNSRYQTPQALSADLIKVAEKLGMRPSEFSLDKWYLPSKSQLMIWKDRLAWAIPIVALIIIVLVLNCFWQPDQRQSEFLPDTPSLKKSEPSSGNSNGRPAPIFGSIKKGKVLELENAVQSFPPTPEDPAPNESQTLQPPVVAEEQTPAPDSVSPSDSQPVPPPAASPKVVQPVRKSSAASTVLNEPNLPDSSDNASQRNATQGNSNQRNIIHSIKLETD